MRSMRLAAGLAALLFLFPWLAVTLVANLALIPLSGGSPTPVGDYTNSPGTSVIVQPSVVNGPSSLELAALAAVVASAVAIYAWRLNKRRRREDEYYWHYEQPKGNPLLTLALLGVAVVSFYALYLVLEDSPTLAIGGQVGSLPPVLPYLTLSAVVAGFVIAALVSISALRSDRFRARRTAEANEVDRTELSKVLSTAADSLDLGSDYRRAILRCYAAMCQVLDRGGSEDSSRLTAREFESRIAAKLNIGRTYLHEATVLFEKARYSTTVLNEKDVERSQLCLRELSEEVLSPHGQEAGV